MLTLLFLLNTLVILNEARSSEYLDESFVNTNNLVLRDEHDYDTMHAIKCTQNTNSPFDQYNKHNYKLDDSPDYQYCDIKTMEKDSLSKIVRIKINTQYPDKIFPEITKAFEFLKNSQFITENVPTFKNILNKFYGQFGQLIQDMPTALKQYNDFVEANLEFKAKIRNAVNLNNEAVNNKAYIATLLDSIDNAKDVCNGIAQNDINIYKNIVSSFSIKDCLGEHLSSIKEKIATLKVTCEEEKVVPQMGLILSSTLESYKAIRDLLAQVYQQLITQIMTINNEYLLYDNLIKRIETKPYKKITVKLRSSLDLLSKIGINYITAEQITIEIKNRTQNVSKKLTQFSNEDRLIIEIILSDINNHFNNFQTIVQNKKALESRIKAIETQIELITSQHSEVLKQATNQKNSARLTIDVFEGLKQIQLGLITHHSYVYLSTRLSKYLQTPWNYEFIRNHSNIENYLRTTTVVLDAQIDSIIKNLNENNLKTKLYLKNLIYEGEKLVNYLHAEKIPKLDIIEEAPQNIDKMSDNKSLEKPNDASSKLDIISQKNFSNKMITNTKVAVILGASIGIVMLFIVFGFIIYKKKWSPFKQLD